MLSDSEDGDKSMRATLPEKPFLVVAIKNVAVLGEEPELEFHANLAAAQGVARNMKKHSGGTRRIFVAKIISEAVEVEEPIRIVEFAE